MSDKRSHPHRPVAAKPASESGTFKHVSKGTDLSAVLRAYKISQADLKRVRELVVGKEPTHAR